MNAFRLGEEGPAAPRARMEREEHRGRLWRTRRFGGDRTAQSLGSAYEGEHNAYDDDDDRHPKEEVRPAHGGAGHAAEP